VVVVPPPVREALAEHARGELPNESCGLLVLRDRVADRYEPGRNAAESPYRFELEVDPDLWFLEDEGYELAVVHSHAFDERISNQEHERLRARFLFADARESVPFGVGADAVASASIDLEEVSQIGAIDPPQSGVADDDRIEVAERAGRARPQTLTSWTLVTAPRFFPTGAVQTRRVTEMTLATIGERNMARAGFGAPS